jgi:4-phosphopantoate--beta-alanine ligase
VNGIPPSHPRRKSLEIRETLTAGYRKGLVCEAGLIAQGRGEAFDYFLCERSGRFAARAAEAAAASLLLAARPVISVNGNLAALCPEETVKLAEACRAKVEVNLFYRTEGRVRRIAAHLRKAGAKEVLGAERTLATIPELFSSRRRVSREGIYAADVVLLAMEDGDRTRALRRMGKRVIAIDLNPLSVTAREADITIVDNAVRAMPALVKAVRRLKRAGRARQAAVLKNYNNKRALREAVACMNRRLSKLAGGRR